MSFKPQVKVNSEWVGNRLAFATSGEAVACAKNLMLRWTLVADCRCIDSLEPVSYRWVTGEGLQHIASSSPPIMPPDRVQV